MIDRKLYLRLLVRQWYILVIAMVAGAAVFGGARFLKENFFSGPAVYRNDSTYYITFTQGQQDVTQLYYNDYTWNDVLDSDQIAGVAATLSGGMSKEELAEAVSIPTMSDIRIIHVYADHTDPQKADEIQNAVSIALAHFANSAEGFDSISMWDKGSAKEIKAPERISRYAAFGAVLGIIVGYFIAGYRAVVHDEELKERYRL